MAPPVLAQSLLQYANLSDVKASLMSVADAVEQWIRSQDPRVVIGAGAALLFVVFLTAFRGRR